ncbi:hypothetical protein Sbs19_08620 [Sphingobium sp. BS19]|nr:hypothetical protein Sbs19_08620 [Sphingobium sp. BS19]
MKLNVFRICLPLFSLSMPLLVSQEAFGQALFPSNVRFELLNRVAVVDSLQPGFYVPVPLAAVISDGLQGVPAAGLVHSGYSVIDPDGKVAVLSLTIVARRPNITAAEDQMLLQKGYLSGAGNYTGNTSTVSMDVSLVSNPAEEARLRKLLKLPKVIQAGASLPLQIRWESRDGREIYNWLTKPDGLKFVLRYPLVISGMVKVDDFLPVDKRNAWWNALASGGSTLEFKEGVIPVAIDLLRSCGGLSSNASLLRMSQYEGLQLSRTISFLNKITKHGPSGMTFIERDDLLGPAWDSSDVASILQTVAAPELEAGAVFMVKPELVKDLSGTSKGLEGLIASP